VTARSGANEDPLADARVGALLGAIPIHFYVAHSGVVPFRYKQLETNFAKVY